MHQNQNKDCFIVPDHHVLYIYTYTISPVNEGVVDWMQRGDFTSGFCLGYLGGHTLAPLWMGKRKFPFFFTYVSESIHL